MHSVEGGVCHVCARLGGLHVADVAVAVDALTVREQRDLARLAGVAAEGRLAADLTTAFEGLAPAEAHEAARRLLRPLAVSADEAFETAPCLDLRVVVARLAAEWPPALVVLFVELAWEAGDLPAEALDREALDRIDPHSSA